MKKAEGKEDPGGAASCVLMLIDDSPVIVERLVESLGEIPHIHKIVYGFSFSDAEKLLKEHPIGIAVLDINLPDKNGIELLKLIKTQYNSPVIPVIMMTENPSDTNREVSLNSGADHFVDKFEVVENIIQMLPVIFKK